MIVRRLPEASDELYHHGIKGQRWGIRRFQNRDGTLTGAGRKHKGLIDQIRDNRRMKKVRRAKVEKAKQQQKLNEERTKRLQKAAAERKERAEVIKTGSAKDIQKFQNKMSDKEYEKALSRIDLSQRLDRAVADQAKAKSDKMAARLNTVMNTANTLANIADSASKVYGALEKVGVIKKSESPTSKMEKELKKYKDESQLAQYKSNILKYEKDNIGYNKIIKESKQKKKGDTSGIDVSGLDTKVSVLSTDMSELKSMMEEMRDRNGW